MNGLLEEIFLFDFTPGKSISFEVIKATNLV